MERKKRSKGSVWEFCYANKIFGTFVFEMRACGQKLVKFCTLTHIHTHTHTHTHTTAAKLVVRMIELRDVTWTFNVGHPFMVDGRLVNAVFALGHKKTVLGPHGFEKTGSPKSKLGPNVIRAWHLT